MAIGSNYSLKLTSNISFVSHTSYLDPFMLVNGISTNVRNGLLMVDLVKFLNRPSAVHCLQFKPQSVRTDQEIEVKKSVIQDHKRKTLGGNENYS